MTGQELKEFILTRFDAQDKRIYARFDAQDKRMDAQDKQFVLRVRRHPR